MIQCLINGKVAYPDTSNKIKVTYENQFVKDSGSYTYEVQFPMAIFENKQIFANTDRFDVNKRLRPYEDCKLYVDNRLIISGKGTVTKIDNSKVYLQIIGGKSRIKYNSNFEKVYIDKIDYPPVRLTHGLNWDIYSKLGIKDVVLDTYPKYIWVDLTGTNMVGNPGVAVFNPINDDDTDFLSNRLIFDNGYIKPGVQTSGPINYIKRVAVQPNLLYVLTKVIEHEGYKIVRNELDIDPWNRLYIASARKSVRIKDALPHWTVYTFIDEVRKLFNASFVFDDAKKTVSILSLNELINNTAITYECGDEFTSEYDEDGLKNYITSNVEYSFDNVAERDWREKISKEVMKTYETKEYKSVGYILEAVRKMKDKERKTTIFKAQNEYYIWAKVPVNENSDKTKEELIRCGFFNPLIRDLDSDDTINLNICPAATFKRDKWTADEKKEYNAFDIMMGKFDLLKDKKIIVPSVINDKEVREEGMVYDEEEDDYYFTVQDAMQNGVENDSGSADTDDTSEKMPVFFQSNHLLNLELGEAVLPDDTLHNENKRYRWPFAYTDYRLHTDWMRLRERASLSLEELPPLPIVHRYIWNGARPSPTMSAATDEATDVMENTSYIDKHNKICVKFYTDEIPNPEKIYIFRNKKYICEKVEINLTNEGIEKEKTGYFYEFV